MILIVDNYDSFAYNLVQYVGKFDDVEIRHNDAINVADIRKLDPDGIVVSPGSGTPVDAGVSIDVFAETECVCLGRQALCTAHDAAVGHAPEVVQGKPSEIRHDHTGLCEGVDDPSKSAGTTRWLSGIAISPMNSWRRPTQMTNSAL